MTFNNARIVDQHDRRAGGDIDQAAQGVVEALLGDDDVDPALHQLRRQRRRVLLGPRQRSGLALEVAHVRDEFEELVHGHFAVARRALGQVADHALAGGGRQGGIEGRTSDHHRELAQRGFGGLTAVELDAAGGVAPHLQDGALAAAAQIPADRILAETDSPYLAPQSRRGRPNEPANVVHTVAALAEARGEDADEGKRFWADRKKLGAIANAQTVPQVFVGGRLIGGSEELQKFLSGRSARNPANPG